jgi:hypothetical protein
MLVVLGGLGSPAIAQTSGPIYSGLHLDYQPSPLRLANGELLVVIERLNSQNRGDLYLTRSQDGGNVWSLPKPIVATSLNERHPALVQLRDGSLELFYLADQGGAYRIHRATSPDGSSWKQHGALNLGWGTGGEINPSVINEADGSLTMSYHRLNGASYIARSYDGGVTWDTRLTRVSDGNAALPRVAKRESDGLYVVTYQVNLGGGNLELRSKASTNPYDWTGASSVVSTGANGHDSVPLVLQDGTFLVTYIEQSGSAAFDLYYRTSVDGVKWSPATRLTFTESRYDVEPHPILQGPPGYISLFWSYQVSATPYVDHDIWMMRDLPISILE